MIKKSRFVIILALALILPFTMMMLLATSGVMRNAIPPRPEGPCDVYTAAGTPCVTAHSSTRALYSSYKGPLYQVMRQSDGKTLDIGVIQPGENDPGGYADAAAQDAFCAKTLCWITTVYDQSGNGNHLVQAPPGTFRGPAKGGFNTLPIADMAPISIMGHKAYGVYIIPGMGLRNNNARGLAINDEPQSIYMVCDGTYFDSGCCFNYGNTSTNSRAVGRGTMETVYFGIATAWGSGSGPGPWIMSDMEAGLYSGYNAKQNINDPTIDSWRFVTGVVNGGGGNQWEIRGGNETSKRFIDPVMPGASVTASFTVTSPATTGSGFLTGRVEWKNQGTGLTQFESSSQQVRNVFPVKINEIRFETGNNPTNQFIELYNAGDRDFDLSNWTLINTRSEWAPIRLGAIPAGTKLAAHCFYLLGLSGSGLVAAASQGGKNINVRSTNGFENGQQIDIEGETRTIVNVGTAATPMTIIFVPVSTGPWLTIPAGSTKLPVINAAGFEVGQKIGIDPGGNYEVATVTAVGKAASQTTLAVAVKTGETIIKVAANSNMTDGDMLTIGTGAIKELVKVKRIINVVAAPVRGGFGQTGPGNSIPGVLELTTPLMVHPISITENPVNEIIHTL